MIAAEALPIIINRTIAPKEVKKAFLVQQSIKIIRRSDNPLNLDQLF